MKLRTEWILLFALAASPLLGQTSNDGTRDLLRNPLPGARPSAPQTYGANDSLQRIAVQSFAPVASTEGYAYTNGTTSFTRYATIAGSQPFAAHPVLPSGAVVTAVDFDVCDSSASDDISVAVLTTDRFGQGIQQVGPTFTTESAPGCVTLTDDLGATNIIVDNTSQIVLDVILASGDASNSFAGATVHYHLQVSPGPVTADFTDVPTSHPFFQFVEALYHAGITAGCGGGNFCPDTPLTRGQMAVFLSKALGLQFP